MHTRPRRDGGAWAAASAPTASPGEGARASAPLSRRRARRRAREAGGPGQWAQRRKPWRTGRSCLLAAVEQCWARVSAQREGPLTRCRARSRPLQRRSWSTACSRAPWDVPAGVVCAERDGRRATAPAAARKGRLARATARSRCARGRTDDRRVAGATQRGTERGGRSCVGRVLRASAIDRRHATTGMRDGGARGACRVLCYVT
jgi:hypothetical protein